MFRASNAGRYIARGSAPIDTDTVIEEVFRATVYVLYRVRTIYAVPRGEPNVKYTVSSRLATCILSMKVALYLCTIVGETSALREAPGLRLPTGKITRTSQLISRASDDFSYIIRDILSRV